MKKKILFFCFLCSNLVSYSQLLSPELDGTQAPCGIAWKKIETQHFNIIFPNTITEDGQKLANTLEYVYPHVTKTTVPTNKLSVVMQTHLAESNGYATLIPRHSQFYNLPPQDDMNGTNDWYSLLSIHEFRHVSQFAFADRGLSHLAHLIFGNIGQTLAINFALPPWYFEGDAVCTETNLTNSGRGRMPQFTVEQKALLLSGKRYTYEKTVLGSYKDWYPLDVDYSYGYLMCSNIRKHFTVGGLDRIVENSSKWANPYSFSRNTRKVTSQPIYRYHNSLLNELDSVWENQVKDLQITESYAITEENPKSWTYNNFVQQAQDGSFIAFRWGQDDRYKLVQIRNGQIEVLYESNFIQRDKPFSLGKTKIVWSENISDVRWGNCSYNVIKMMDINTKEIRTLTTKSRLVSPAISPDEKYVIAVEYNTSNRCRFVILNMETGVETYIPNLKNEYLQTPTWSPDGKYIVYTKVFQNQKALSITNVQTFDNKDIIPYGNENIAFPVSDGNFIYYQSPYSGIDNIYAINVQTKSRYQVTSRKFGAYYPSLSKNGKQLLFSDVTANGYMALAMNLDINTCKSINEVEKRIVDLNKEMIVEEAGRNILDDSVPQTNYQVKKYHGALGIKNTYAWIPLLDTNKNIGFSIYAKNLLNSFGASLDYQYNYEKKTHFSGLQFSYAGWYPIFDFGGSFGDRVASFDSTIRRVSNYNFNDKDTSCRYRWREKSANIGIRLPFILSRGRFSSALEIGAKVAYTQTSNLTHTETDTYNSLENGNFVPVTFSLSYYLLSRWIKDISYREGIYLNSRYSYMPFESQKKGSLFSVVGKIYMPPPIKYNSFYIDFGYEHQEPVNYVFDSYLTLSRGYGSILPVYKNFYKIDVNYSFPVCYPDIQILHTLYIKRISANLFYDYSQIETSSSVNTLRSAGIELMSETCFFHIATALNIGIRFSKSFDEYIYNNYKDDYNAELVLSLPF